MGGHSEKIAEKLTTGRLICIDRDASAIDYARERLKLFSDRITFVHANFADTVEVLDDLGIEGVNGMLFDLGVSSPQLDETERGFSYNADAFLYGGVAGYYGRVSDLYQNREHCKYLWNSP